MVIASRTTGGTMKIETVPVDADTTLVHLRLTEDERRYLAMHARYESQRQQDVRYWDADETARATRLARWKQIADALHPDPWGTEEKSK